MRAVHIYYLIYLLLLDYCLCLFIFILVQRLANNNKMFVDSNNLISFDLMGTLYRRYSYSGIRYVGTSHFILQKWPLTLF